MRFSIRLTFYHRRFQETGNDGGHNTSTHKRPPWEFEVFELRNQH